MHLFRKRKIRGEIQGENDKGVQTLEHIFLTKDDKDMKEMSNQL